MFLSRGYPKLQVKIEILTPAQTAELSEEQCNCGICGEPVYATMTLDDEPWDLCHACWTNLVLAVQAKA